MTTPPRDELGASGFELGTDGPRVLVVAVDGSPTSLHAAAYALGLCRRQHARLVVVTVATTPATAGMAPGIAAAARESAREVAEELAREGALASERAGVPVEVVPRSGDPYTEICRVCDEVRTDGVVVGASTSAGHRLVGSLVVRLVKAGRWPVTVVP